jgi:post-segregation antitoxin (ccd killing protein)
MDKLDLYSSKQRQVFINQASVELGLKDEIIKKDLGKVLLTLEEQQAKQQDDHADKQPAELEPEDRKIAFELLHDADLLNRILSDFNQAGVVGEETNKLAGYLACVSRKLERPLAVMIQSSSAAGKSSLMESILALMPEEERVQYSAMTGQSLFYMGETNLKNKILAISEEEGASNASYALKLLQSEGEVTIASTGKDDTTGNLITKEYKVEGPVMLFLTTTAIDIDEELLNRCVVLSVNESREQTQAIHAAQRSRRTLQGLHNKIEKERIIQLHRNAQRLLKPLAVINPYADQLTLLDDKTRTRRDHEKYLTLIDSIALLHQYQRDVKTIQHNGSNIDYVEVTLDDIETANRLAHDILGRTLDELPPQTRKLLKHIQTLVQRECKAQGIEQRDFRFSRKSIRDFTQWSDGQLKIHCKRLEDMEYLLVHRGGRGHSIEYELLYTGDIDTDQAQMMGLLDVEQLKKQHYDKQKSGQKHEKTAPSQGQVRPKSDPEKSLQATPAMAYSESSQSCHKNALEAV